ncbi:MAG: hypothetical protein ACI4S4_07965 [Candidatus Ornithospirochaeta sp.]
MVTREELFLETEKKIEDTTESLRESFHTLGSLVYSNLSVLPVEMGVSLLEEVRKAEKEKKEAYEKKDRDTEFQKSYEEKKKRKIEVDEELLSLREEEKTIRLRLGALIYEQCSLGLLDRAKFSSVYADSDEEKALSEKAEGKSFFSRLSSRSALSRLKKSDSSRYLDYSSLVDSEENALLVNGANAEALVTSLKKNKTERDALRIEQEELEMFLTENLQEYRRLGKGGLEEDSERVGDSEVSLRECLINYGNYLYDRGGSWIGEETSPEILDVLQNIIETQNQYRDLNNRKSRLQKEAKADDYKALIEEEKEKIRILEGEREKIALQIEDIKKEISRLEGLVRKLVDQ